MYRLSIKNSLDNQKSKGAGTKKGQTPNRETGTGPKIEGDRPKKSNGLPNW